MSTWKPIQNFEDLYEINENGDIRSKNPRYKNKELLKQSINSKGYKVVTLCREGKQKTFTVHRLVALAFIPNPNNLPCVNHKDEIKINNNISNLEWCSYYYNNTYGERLTKSSLKKGKPVRCIEENKIYPNAHIASKITKISQSSIWCCCSGKRNSAGGYHWEYV